MRQSKKIKEATTAAIIICIHVKLYNPLNEGLCAGGQVWFNEHNGEAGDGGAHTNPGGPGWGIQVWDGGHSHCVGGSNFSHFSPIYITFS